MKTQSVALPNIPTTGMRNIRKIKTRSVAIPNNPETKTTFSHNTQHLKTTLLMMGTCISGKAASKEIGNYETENMDCTTMVDGEVVTSIMRTHADMLKPTQDVIPRGTDLFFYRRMHFNSSLGGQFLFKSEGNWPPRLQSQWFKESGCMYSWCLQKKACWNCS
jgi:hypothetical protein